MKPRGRTGFTLIELLVVIAIIAILAAILFPVFAKAREKARQSSCQSNCKQMSLGVLQYAQDYDETMAPNIWSDGTTFAPVQQRTFLQMILPYTKNVQVYVCPSATGVSYTPGTAGATYTQVPQNTYGMSAWSANAKMATITAPAETIMVMDVNYIYIDGYDCSSRWCFRHNEGANIAFDDGHVKWRKSRTPRPAELWPTLTGFNYNGTANVQWSAVPTSTCVP